MKKLSIICLLTIISLFSLLSASCKETDSFLLSYVSEERSDVLVSNGDYDLKAYYGFKETPYLNDAKVGERKYKLTFILTLEEPSEVSYSLIIPEENDCKLTFTKNNNGLYAELEKENFTAKSLQVKLCFAENIIDLTLTSIIPEGAMTLNQVLYKLQVDQENLVTHYLDGLEFKAEIYARILYKNQKVYWYIAFADGNNLKAFLVDGTSVEVLAIREVI